MRSPVVQNRLKIAVFLTFFVLCAEAVGGILANSLALISDAAHMLGDVFSLSLSWFALKIAHRPSTNDKTYGYHRIETFAALINGLLLVLMACGILYEAFHRYSNPSEVQTQMVMIVAAVGLTVNLGVVYFLKDPFHQTRDLNLKSAFYHVLGDLVASLGVLIGGAVMWWTGWYEIDPLLAAAISCLLLWGARRVLSEAVHILLEGVPRGISVSDVKKELSAIPSIQGIHELHIWCICSNIYALSTHALVDDQQVNQVEPILNQINQVLESKFNITHSTIQFESIPCQVARELCDISH